MPNPQAAAVNWDPRSEQGQVTSPWDPQLSLDPRPPLNLQPIALPSYHSTHWDGLHHLQEWGSFVSYEGAAALMPLRGRDREALRELFDRSDIAQIEANIEANVDQWSIGQDWEGVGRWLL